MDGQVFEDHVTNMPQLGDESFADWVIPDFLAVCAYPSSDEALSSIAQSGITLLLNVDMLRHSGARLRHHGLDSIHVPVPDLAAPTARQIEACIGVLEGARESGERIAVHCRAGLGRTGTVVACYLLSIGLDPDTAVTAIRKVRPGSIETGQQLEAVYDFAERMDVHLGCPPGRATYE